MGWLFDQTEEKGRGPDEMAKGELTDVKIDGDRATGVIKQENREDKISFVKVDGRWYLGVDM